MISAIILNYRNADLTCRCVDTLLAAAQQAAIQIEAIVVDNSATETADELRMRLPARVTLIENAQNDGFSKANNIGIERASGEYILIMNNDLFVNAEVLHTGMQFLQNHDTAGIWAPTLTGPEGDAQRSCAQFPTLRGLVTEYLFKLQYDNRIAEQAVRANHPVEVDTVIGACMLIPRDVIKKIGGFDEDYFFNVEDVDLCFKIKNRGHGVYFDPRCSAIHLVGASQDSHWHEDPYLHKSRMLYFKKNQSAAKSLLATLVIRTGIKMRTIKHRFLPA